MPPPGRPLVVLRWVPLAALTAAVGIGAWLGSTWQSTPAAPAQSRLQEIIDSTKQAGSAQVTYSSVSTGSNSLLVSTSSGSGVVDFASGDFRINSIQHSTDLSSENGQPEHPVPDVSTNEEVKAGDHLYDSIAEFPGSPSTDQWIKPPTLTESPPIVFGAFDGSDASGALQPLSLPYQRLAITANGQRVVEGDRTTLYQVTVFPKRCDISPLATRGSSQVDLWVDSRMRLVQAADTIQTAIPRPPSAATAQRSHIPAERLGERTTTSTLRLFDFGTPVQISVPRPLVHESGGSLTFSTSSGCP